MILLTHKKFILIVGFLLLLFSSLYWGLFNYQLGANIKAEWWLKNVYDYKDHIASQKTSPKIIIISGSNSLFGIDSSVIENLSGYPVVNLAGHAALDISFFYLKLKEHMRIGDIVVMPLEFGFFQQSKITDWFANNMLAWGKEDYLDQLDYFNLLKFIISVPKSRIYEGILNNSESRSIIEEDIVISTIENLIIEEGTDWRGYDYKSLNQFGDIVSGNQVTKELLAKTKKGFHYYGGWDISDRFLNYYKKIQALVHKRQGRLILTWSVTMNNRLFDLSVSKYQDRIKRMLANLDEESIYLSCDPELFNYDVELFFDTEFHLNKHGAAIRSENLALCINQTLNKFSDTPLPDRKPNN